MNSADNKEIIFKYGIRGVTCMLCVILDAMIIFCIYELSINLGNAENVSYMYYALAFLIFILLSINTMVVYMFLSSASRVIINDEHLSIIKPLGGSDSEEPERI